MKPTFITLFVLLSAAVCSHAQSPVLESYYELKDALVSSNASAAAAQAGKFVSIINRFELADSSAGKAHAISQALDKLRAGGQSVATAKSIGQQREYFAGLSDNLFSLLKTIKLATEPVYRQYCPMKKAYWLSNEPAIRNPYYGQAMLTCGNITDTLTP